MIRLLLFFFLCRHRRRTAYRLRRGGGRDHRRSVSFDETECVRENPFLWESLFFDKRIRKEMVDVPSGMSLRIKNQRGAVGTMRCPLC